MLRVSQERPLFALNRAPFFLVKRRHLAPRTGKKVQWVVLLALNEADNIRVLILRLVSTLKAISDACEIIVDGGSTDGTGEVAAGLGARAILQKTPGYGAA